MPSMSRFKPLVAFLGLTGALLSGWGLAVVACGGDAEGLMTPTSSDAGPALRRDAAPVEPTEAGAPLDSGVTPAPTCASYCDLVMASCKGANAQYATTEDCLAFCTHLPLSRDGDVKEAPSVACRQYWADGPARTSPETYCLAAGPFGGNMCGDRCTAFCTVLLSACSPDGGDKAYGNQPECATACADFAYRDGGVDGGGEGPEGPDAGDTLNCRLYWLREATKSSASCALLRPPGEVCKK